MLCQDKGEVSGENDHAVLHILLRVDACDEPDHPLCHHETQQQTHHHHIAKLQKGGTIRFTCRQEGADEKHEADDTRTIVEDRLRIDQGRETLTGLQLMQQGDHRHRIGRADQGTKHQGKGPSPSGKLRHDSSDTHHQQAGQQHRDHQAGCRQQDGIDHGLLENMHVQLVCRIKDQDRQKEIKDQVRMDIDHGVNAH